MDESYRFLRKVPLFAELSDDDLGQICHHVEEIHLSAGELLFNEGSIGRQAFVIKEGQIEIFKASNGKSFQLAVRISGEVIGEMSMLDSAPRIASGRALTDSLVLAIHYDDFEHLLDTSPSAARTILHTVTSRLQSTETLLRQNEKMAQLGTFTAGIAHEFNNPSTAVLRGAEQLKIAFQAYQTVSSELNLIRFNSAQASRLGTLDAQIRQRAQSPVELDPLSRSDRETELEEWLEAHDFEQSWNLAPQLVSIGFGLEEVGELKAAFPPQSLVPLVEWVAAGFTIYQLVYEIGHGASRISEIVKALKSYIYLDQGPIQEVNIHEGLENTLIILRYKLKQGVEVKRDFDPNVPPVQAHGSELNQVWTNIIDNAIDAMDGKGRITLKTSYHDPWVVVEIIDNGPGIPQEVQSKLFSPFFTTKPVGKGTGIGLNISYNIIHRHGGDIKVYSQPGETHFEIWLPKNFQQAPEETPRVIPKQKPNEPGLRNM